MSEEYTLMQYENERLKQDLLYWRQVATEQIEKQNAAMLAKTREIEQLNTKVDELAAENEEYKRTNDRIWTTTKHWIMEDSTIISKQAGQIKYLVAKLKAVEGAAMSSDGSNEK